MPPLGAAYPDAPPVSLSAPKIYTQKPRQRSDTRTRRGAHTRGKERTTRVGEKTRGCKKAQTYLDQFI